MKPIFLFSLPRSGSTLLQKILMSHDKIESVAEPWLLLPLVYMAKKEGTVTEYGHEVLYMAMEDLIGNLRHRHDDYYGYVSQFVVNIYQNISKQDSLYFLDKTPRYYYIIREIHRIFPEGKFIFLLRNPMHIYASVISMKYGRYKRFFQNESDLVLGPKLLAQGYMELRDKAFLLRYEDFVFDPEKHLRDLLQYLELDFDENLLDSYRQQDLKGRLGDPRNIRNYEKVTSETTDKWRKIFDTPWKRFHVEQYVKAVDSTYCNIGKYDKQEIIGQLKSLPPCSKQAMIRHPYDYIFRDPWEYLVASARKKLKLNLNDEGFFWTKNRHLS